MRPTVREIAGFAALAWMLGACGNGFTTVNRCIERKCSACASDDDCEVIVDCCREQNVCTHRENGVGTCKMWCDQLENPPRISCVASRCLCG